MTVVEKAEIGGTCLNWGCIPTKAWIGTAHLYEQIKRAKEFGIEVGEPKVRWDWLLERKNKVVKQLTGGVKTLLTGRQVDILKGTGRLTGANRIAIALADGGTSEITTDHVILATGAHAWNPPGWSLDGERVIGSKEALELSKQPKRVAILGGGVIGCEFAGFFAEQVLQVHPLWCCHPSSGTAVDSTDAMSFAARHDVRPMIERYPHADAGRAVEDMMGGAVRFRVVLETEGPVREGATSPSS